MAIGGNEVDDGSTEANFSRFTAFMTFITEREEGGASPIPWKEKGLFVIASINIIDCNKLGNVGGWIVGEVGEGYIMKYLNLR